MRDLGSKCPTTGKKRRGMALPLVILLVIVGFVFVGVGAYVVQNLFWSSQGVVIEAKLYNAAQSGIEWGMATLWKERNRIEADTLTYDGDIKSIRARFDDLKPNEVSTEDSSIIAFGEAPPIDISGVTSINVLLLDCNYTNSVTVDPGDNLPPQVKVSRGSGGSSTGIPAGTSVIIDPSRFLPLGGGVTERRFVVVSTATGWGRKVELEAMVVMSK